MALQLGRVTLDVLNTRKVSGVGKKSGKPYEGLIVEFLLETENGRKPGSFLMFGYDGPEIGPGPQSFDFKVGVTYQGSIEFRAVGPSATK